jgi:Domain of unknown function (DUF6471)
MTPNAALVNGESVRYDLLKSDATPMGLAKSEAELAERAARFLKAELRRANMTYEELAERLKKHGHPHETVDSIKAKLKRGTFPATFMLACAAAIGLEAINLGDV